MLKHATCINAIATLLASTAWFFASFNVFNLTLCHLPPLATCNTHTHVHLRNGILRAFAYNLCNFPLIFANAVPLCWAVTSALSSRHIAFNNHSSAAAVATFAVCENIYFYAFKFFQFFLPAAIFYYCCAACHLLAVVCCCMCANVATPACNGTNIVYWLFAVTVATDATDATARASVCDCNYVCGLCCGCMHSKSALAHMPPCVSMHVATCAYRLSNALQMALR